MLKKVAPLFQWNVLGRLVNSQLARIGTAATIIVPIVFSAIAAVSEFLSAIGIVSHPSDTQSLWRYLASQLYAGGVAIVLSKFLVDIFCPEAIRRYATREEFVSAAANYRSAVATLDRFSAKLVGREDAVVAKMAEALAAAQKTALATIGNWDSANQAYPQARIAAGLLFYLGGILVGVFLLARLVHNIKDVLGLG